MESYSTSSALEAALNRHTGKEGSLYLSVPMAFTEGLKQQSLNCPTHMPGISTNYFASATAASHYRQGRPDFHANTIARVKAFLGLEEPLERALDIACGTGLSAKALLSIARQVDGTDNAAGMLRQACPHPRIQYTLAPAERQPFPDRCFDLITVCSGVHWFPIDAFLAECRRLLRSDGWLVLYDNFFPGESRESEGFKPWYERRYLEKFPAPQRNGSYDWGKAHLAELNLDFVQDEQFSNEVVFGRQSLIRYFITQSNIIRAVNTGDTTYEAAAAWLDAELRPFFPDNAAAQTLRFGNWIKYLKPL